MAYNNILEAFMEKDLDFIRQNCEPKLFKSFDKANELLEENRLVFNESTDPELEVSTQV
jgi:predicted lipid-binding transport protein (Tim44 family)